MVRGARTLCQRTWFSNGKEVMCGVVYVFGQGDLYIPLKYIVGIQLHTIRSQPVSLHTKLLLESYFQNRYQSVQITNSYSNSHTVSKWTKLTCGVPQRSILGPLLFLAYFNDLPKAVAHKALPILYADDTSILQALTTVKCRVILI